MLGALHEELSTAVAIRFEGPGSIGMDFEGAPATEMEKCFPVAQFSTCFFVRSAGPIWKERLQNVL
jgi:hypothetical protein